MTITRYVVEERVNNRWWPLDTRINLRVARLIARYHCNPTRVRRVSTTAETVKPHEVR